jgi:hypothetical protein
MSSNEFALSDQHSRRLAQTDSDRFYSKLLDNSLTGDERLEVEVDYYTSLGVNQLELMRSFNSRLLTLLRTGLHDKYLGIWGCYEVASEDCLDIIHDLSYVLTEIYDRLDIEEEAFEASLRYQEHDGSGN